MSNCEECVYKGTGPYEAISTNHGYKVCGHHRLPYKLTLLEGAESAGGSASAGAVGTRGGGGRANVGHAVRVSKMHLNYLTLPQLRALCDAVEETTSGNKDEVIARLVNAGVSYGQLRMDDLKDLLDEMDLPLSGSKAALIERITCSGDMGPARTPAVGARGGGGGGGGNGVRVSKMHLNYLTLPQLRDLCDAVDERTSGSKDEVIARLVNAGVSYGQLLVEDLKDILDRMDLPLSGSKAALIERITSGGSGGSIGGGASAVAAVKVTIATFESGAMSRSAFRSRMEKAGRPLRPGQDVCHIISEANGGANHSDNYFVASEAFNRSTGSRHDCLIAYIAGKDLAEKAVAISKAMMGYSGPTAAVLYCRGEEVFRMIRAESRNRNE
jgi:hypothetical protein